MKKSLKQKKVEVLKKKTNEGQKGSEYIINVEEEARRQVSSKDEEIYVEPLKEVPTIFIFLSLLCLFFYVGQKYQSPFSLTLLHLHHHHH